MNKLEEAAKPLLLAMFNAGGAAVERQPGIGNWYGQYPAGAGGATAPWRP